jgi:hypothetical protein
MLPLIFALATAPVLMMRGEISGDLRLGDKYLADVKLTLTCGTESVEGATDKSGSFRLTVKGSGKCQLKVTYDKQAPSIDVVLFDQPARYRFLLEQQDGKYLLKRV